MGDGGVDPSPMLLRFNAEFLPAALKALPPDVQGQVTAGLCKTFDDAAKLLPACELVLGKRLTPDELRTILFFPDENAAAMAYPKLIAPPPDGSDEAHPQFRSLAKALANLYLVHVEKSWEHFVRPFILGGGLDTLLALFHLDGSEPRLMARGQAMNVFYRITNEELHAWHDSPAREATDDRRAHAILMQLHSEVVGACLANQPPAAFPGASDTALCILAWYLGWLRHRFGDPKRPMRLSRSLLAAIGKWGESCDADNERELAKKLFEDFERFGVLEDRGDSAASTTAQDCGGELAEGLEVEALVAPDDADVGAVEELVEDDELGMD